MGKLCADLDCCCQFPWLSQKEPFHNILQTVKSSERCLLRLFSSTFFFFALTNPENAHNINKLLTAPQFNLSKLEYPTSCIDAYRHVCSKVLLSCQDLCSYLFFSNFLNPYFFEVA